MVQVRRALLSVSDKTGLVEFAKGLAALGVEMISTGGTAKVLREAGLKSIDISEVTGFPEMLDGRVKTLHPKIHGALLHLRSKPEHLATIEAQGIQAIDMVVVNLYPFQSTVAKPDVSFDEAIENIDIGGPSMIRSGAKNFRSVAVLVKPKDYEVVLKEMQGSQGRVSEATLERLVVEAFAHTAEFDRCVHAYLQQQLGGKAEFPQTLNLHFEKAQDLRYGENPHQKGAFYLEPDPDPSSVAAAKQLWGKELSFNNIMDLEAALETVKDFSQPAAVIVKHANPCGAAQAPSIAEAYRRAFEADSISAFGGIVALNRRLDMKTVEAIGKTVLDCIIAPGYDADALEALKTRKNLRMMEVSFDGEAKKPLPGMGFESMAMKKISGGLLLQNRDLKRASRDECRVVSKRRPNETEWADMLFAWHLVAHVKSNAIVIAKGDSSVGVGPGQTNRVGSVKIAAEAAGERAKGASLASDAFFPFRDGVDAAAKAGVMAIIQPGGSVNDKETIAAADEHGLAMVFTGMRHFYH